MAVEVRQALERDYDIVMTTEEVRKMTVAQCRELEKTKPTKKAKSESRRNVETSSPESSASGPSGEAQTFLADLAVAVETMPHLVIPFEDRQRKKETEDFSIRDLASRAMFGEKNPVFIFPGIESTFEILEDLIAKISLPAYGVNWAEELEPMRDWPTIVNHIIEKILARFPKIKQYNLVAFSAGTMTAFQVARGLQERGRKVGPLIFLDGAPSVVHRAISKSYEREISPLARFDTFAVYFASQPKISLGF